MDDEKRDDYYVFAQRLDGDTFEHHVALTEAEADTLAHLLSAAVEDGRIIDYMVDWGSDPYTIGLDDTRSAMTDQLNVTI